MSAALVLVAAVLASTSTSGDELAQLRAQLDAHPEDADVRLRLALALSRRGETKEARAHAESVVQDAPQYWDAHLLLARLDAWEQRYDDARERLNLVIAAEPGLRDAQTQLAELELWAGELDRSEATLELLLEQEQSADLLARLAQVEYEQQDHLSAYLLARDALALDPEEKRALSVKDAVTLVRADLRVELENLPGSKEGHGEILSIVAFPGNYYGFSITEEFRQRYGTTNNRVSFEGRWVPRKAFVLSALFAFGLPAEVISKISASIRGSVPIFGPLDAGLSYSFDLFPDSVHLHRARADFGFRIHDTVQAALAYMFGYLIDMPRDEKGTLHYGEAEVRWELLPFAVSAAYGFGRSIDRIVIDPRAPLLTYLSHEIRFSAAYEPERWIRVGVDLGSVLRSNKTQVDTLGILARFNF
jgi:tetratricopeptide (TPR) repeat protein